MQNMVHDLVKNWMVLLQDLVQVKPVGRLIGTTAIIYIY